jgi:hypothetical protein
MSHRDRVAATRELVRIPVDDHIATDGSCCESGEHKGDLHIRILARLTADSWKVLPLASGGFLFNPPMCTVAPNAHIRIPTGRRRQAIPEGALVVKTALLEEEHYFGVAVPLST